MDTRWPRGEHRKYKESLTAGIKDQKTSQAKMKNAVAEIQTDWTQ